MKQSKLKLLTMIVSLFIVSGCLTVRLPYIQINYPQKESRLTWKNAVAQTLQNNPDLARARFNITSSARTRDSAFGDYLPSVSGSYDRNRSRTTSVGARPVDSMGFDITGSQPLFTGGSTTGTFIKAKKDLEVSKLAYQETSANIRFQLRSVYVELLRLEKLLGANRQIEERRKQNADLIRLRYNAGLEHLGSAMRTDAIFEQASYNVRQVLRRTESQSLLLGQVTGSGFMIPAKVDGDMEKMISAVPSTTPNYAELASQIPSVRKLIKSAESSKAAVATAQSAVWPQVSSNIDYGYNGKWINRMKDSLSFGLTVTLPFFNGGKNIAAILKAKADYEAAFEAAESAQNAAVADLADAWARLRDAVETVDVRKKFLEASRKRSEIVRAQYTTGLASFQDFDTAEQELADSETAYVQSLADALTQKANWESTKGLTLEDVSHETE